MNNLFISMKSRMRCIASQLGIGTVVVLILVVTQGAPLMQWIQKTNASTSIESTTEPIIRSTENKCEEKIEKVQSPGKVKRLVIPQIEMGLPIVSVPMSNGTWDVEEGVANYAQETSPFNGDVGNSVLFGHNKPDAFRPIAQLKKGDEVSVQTSKYQFTYEVVQISTTAPKNVDVMKPGTEKQLTLITCNGMFDQKRLVVVARLKVITQLNCKE